MSKCTWGSELVPARFIIWPQALEPQIRYNAELKTVLAPGAEFRKLSGVKRSINPVCRAFSTFFEPKHHFALHDEVRGFKDETEINEIQ